MSLRQESLRLYRDILRASKLFPHRNEQGVAWSEVLRKSARKEFEDARTERDPLIVSRLLVVGRDCLNQTVEKLERASKHLEEHIDRSRTSR